MWALTTSPLPKASQVPFSHFIALAKLAHMYGFRLAREWALACLYTLITSDYSPLRHAPSELFVRLLHLALRCSDARIAVVVQSMWSDRIHIGQLPAGPAIVFAEEYDFRLLLVHAYYAQMLRMVPGRALGKLPVADDSGLSPSQKTHILEGYYSLLVYWRHLRDNPLDIPLSESSTCSSHDMCVAAWKDRWTYTAEYPIPFPSVDILRRLRFMKTSLVEDRTLQSCMSSRCRNAALGALVKKTHEIGDNMFHHFDL
ncbi:hypothetical protein HGRIS_006182 [Hohenbuehelia grisea]|uniref:Uncharacterized protein n=1 Tax=Hohenbuehelia grisea TaxID=104357 RepID=A0ABR3K0Q4_9AGAR